MVIKSSLLLLYVIWVTSVPGYFIIIVVIITIDISIITIIKCIIIYHVSL